MNLADCVYLIPWQMICSSPRIQASDGARARPSKCTLGGKRWNLHQDLIVLLWCIEKRCMDKLTIPVVTTWSTIKSMQNKALLRSQQLPE